MQQTKSQPPVIEDQELDASSLAAIRSVLTAQDESGAKKLRKPTPKRRQQDHPEPDMHREVPTASTPPEAAQIDDTPPPAKERSAVAGKLITGFRPAPRHLLFLGLLIVAVFRPWLVIGLLVLSGLVMVGVFLILGYDGFWRRIMSGARWYARRRPARAAALQRKLDRFAMRWDAVLDRFPEGTVDGLYLPDFGHLAEADARHDAALDRRFETLRNTQG